MNTIQLSPQQSSIHEDRNTNSKKYMNIRERIRPKCHIMGKLENIKTETSIHNITKRGMLQPGLQHTSSQVC